ncbi:ABC transporter ATP-binding protein [Acidilobus saccharovorans]|uniref:ABC transporter ATP-binding protein n=1 Tax=Acidilobus saccharovorans TaxID=242703 RepID=UPI000AA7D15F|nr:ATP-binding cassette domain-containing protein [Acidilobus saccharovorans]
MDGVTALVRDVSKAFGRVAVLQRVSLEARAGEVHAVVGPNGVGKTTLLRIIAGIIRPDEGLVKVEGRVSLVPQGDSLLPWRSALRNITLPLEVAGMPMERAREEAVKIAERLGITRFLGSYPRELSGGTRRKVAIARSLITDPDVLLLDEPYTGLDLEAVRSLNDIVRSLAREGKTIIIVSHQIEETAQVADVVTAIAGRPGRVVAHEDLRKVPPSGRAELIRKAAGWS